MHPQILIRPAVPADYDAIARITRDAYLAAGYFESADHPYMRQIQDVARRAAKATIWVAERAGSVIGSVTLAVTSLDEQIFALREGGFDPGDPMISDEVKVVMIKDPDGNSIAFAEALDTTIAQ